MIECQFRPIDQWPSTPTKHPKASAFKAKWSQTLDQLERELHHLRAKDIIVEGYFEFYQIRNDGWPKSLAKPSKPGVVLSFEIAKKGRMVMPCDTFDHWESNLRAIALTLEHLRAVERYGVTSDRQEQYTGWLKLPAAAPEDEAKQLALGLAQIAGAGEGTAASILTNQALFEQVWKEAARRTHSDTGNGSTAEFQSVMEARDRLRKLKGWT